MFNSLAFIDKMGFIHKISTQLVFQVIYKKIRYPVPTFSSVSSPHAH